MFKYPPTVEEINQTTTLNQPFQIEFTVLPAKSDSESNLQDRIKMASSNVRCTVQVNVKLCTSIVLYVLSNCKQHITSLSLLIGTTAANQ